MSLVFRSSKYLWLLARSRRLIPLKSLSLTVFNYYNSYVSLRSCRLLCRHFQPDKKLSFQTSCLLSNGVQDTEQETPFGADIIQKPFNLQQELYKLEADARQMEKLSLLQVQKVIAAMKQADNVKSSEGLLIIRCCGHLIPEMSSDLRTKLVQDVWNMLTKLNCDFDVSHYNALLKIYLENEHKFDPVDFLENMKKQRVESNQVTYQRLISRYCQTGDIEGAKIILEIMKNNSVPVNEQIFNELILGHAVANDMTSARGILNIMRDSDIDPSPATYCALACGYSIMGEIENVIGTLQESKARDLALKDKDILQIIYTLIVNNHGDLVVQILPKLGFEAGYSNECIRIVLELVNRGHHHLAFLLLNTIPKAHVTAGTGVAYELLFIKQIVQQCLPLKEVIDYCFKLKKQGMQELALLKATETALVLHKTDDATVLLKELHSQGFKLRPHFFWPFIVWHNENDSGVYDTLKLMVELKCPADFNTFTDNVFPIISLVDLNTVVQKLKNIGYQVTDILNPLCVFLVQEGHVQTAAKLLEKYPVHCIIALLVSKSLAQGYVLSKDTASTFKIIQHCHLHPLIVTHTKTENDIFGKFLLNLVRTSGCDGYLLESFLKIMEQKNIRISPSAYEDISRNLGNLHCSQIITILQKLSALPAVHLYRDNLLSKHKLPSEMTIDELQSCLIERKARGLRITEVLHNLLILYARNRDLEHVKEIIKELNDNNFIYRGNTYSILMEVFCYHGDLDRAMHYKLLIDKEFPRFRVDFYKIIDLATLLAVHKKYLDAENLISNYHSMFGRDDGKGVVATRNVFRLLDAFANSEDLKHAQKIMELLEDYGYCAPSNVVLGPLVKAYLLRNDIPGAVDEYLRIIKTYHKTPWNKELLKHLIQLEDSEAIQKVTDAAATVHGRSNSILDLALAFIDCGHLQEALKLVKGSGLQVKETRINALCENYVKHNKVKELESFVQVAKYLSGVNKDDTYYQLLRAYINNNYVDKALNVWRMMQEQDVAPSNRTMRLLGTFLQQKKLPVPFIIPQDNSMTTVAKGTHRLNDLSVTNISSVIANKLEENCLSDALKLSDQLFSAGLCVLPDVAQKLALKLSQVKDVRNLSKLCTRLPQDIARSIPFTNYFAACFNKQSCAEEFFNILETEIFKYKFPLGSILALLDGKPEILEKVKTLSDECHKSGVPELRKILWIYYMRSKMFQEADELFCSTPEMKSHLYVLHLKKHVRESNDVEISKKFLDVVMDTNVPVRIKGIIYSSHINVLLSMRNLPEALKVFNQSQSIVDLDDLNRDTLVRLKEHLSLGGMTVPFQLPREHAKDTRGWNNEVFEEWH